MKKIILGLFVFVSVFLVTGCGGIKEKDLINTTWEYHSDTQDYKYEFKKGGKVVYSYHSDDNIYSSDYSNTFDWKLNDYLEIKISTGTITFEYNKDDDSFVRLDDKDFVLKKVK